MRRVPRAVLMLLEPIYEQDFLDCSWGFRRGRVRTRHWSDSGTTSCKWVGAGR
jgi:hypothetical protein